MKRWTAANFKVEVEVYNDTKKLRVEFEYFIETTADIKKIIADAEDFVAKHFQKYATSWNIKSIKITQQGSLP